jgi:lysophospholipase L1-like esterase
MNVALVVVAAAIMTLPGCGTASIHSGNSSGSSLHLVALGDSISTDTECPGCKTFADLYGQAIARRTGTPVQVENLSVPGATSADLLNLVKNDAATRAAVSQADILTITIGFNDTPWGRIDDPCDAAPHFPIVKWHDITDACIARVTHDYEQWLDQILSTVIAIRGGKPTRLRVTTVYNAVIGDHGDPGWDSPAAVAPSIKGNAAFARVQCRIAEKYGGRCADMLHAMNGPQGTRDAAPYLADHTHMNQAGHRLTAQVLSQLDR